MTISELAGVFVGLNVCGFVYLILVLTSPQWSESLGRKLISHSQALRDFFALFRQARQVYGNTYRAMKEELSDVTY